MKIYGRNSVIEALKSESITCLKLLIAEGLHGKEYNEVIELAKARKIKYSFVNRKIIENELAGLRDNAAGGGLPLNHQGFVLETTEFKYCGLEDIFKLAGERGKEPFIIMLSNLTDAHNFGAIIRTCECAGVDGIIISKNRSVQVNETVLKTSSGAAGNMLICQVVNLAQTLEELKGRGVFVFAAEAGGESIYKTNLKGKICLIIGSEGEGVQPLLLKNCDGIISLPQMGKINSLNASVAAGICMYEKIRQDGIK